MGYCCTLDVLFYLMIFVMDLHMLSLDTIVPESLLYVKQDMRFPEFGDMWLFSVIYSDLIPCTHKDTQLTLGLIG